MSKNTKQDKNTYIILNIVGWLIIFATISTQKLFIIIPGFIILILVNLQVMALHKRLKRKNNQNKKK